VNRSRNCRTVQVESPPSLIGLRSIPTGADLEKYAYGTDLSSKCIRADFVQHAYLGRLESARFSNRCWVHAFGHPVGVAFMNSILFKFHVNKYDQLDELTWQFKLHPVSFEMIRGEAAGEAQALDAVCNSNRALRMSLQPDERLHTVEGGPTHRKYDLVKHCANRSGCQHLNRIFGHVR
jgi:hypothetical protein